MLYIIIAVVLVVIVIAVIISQKKKSSPDTEETQKATASIPIEEIAESPKDLPQCEYAPFSHARLLEMGLGEEEAEEFVQELIPEIENKLPSIKTLIESKKHEELERVIHGIKGASNNVGTGGVSELLSEFNTYIRSADIDSEILESYLAHLIKYTDALKKQYS